jgi:hypothetical protein
MWKIVQRAIREGVEFGACAGIVWLLASLVTSLGQRTPLFRSLRQIAGPWFQDISPSTVFLAGVVVYLFVGAGVGVVYCLLNACFSDRTRTRWDRQTALGLLFGAAVWALKIHVVTRYLYPEFLADREYQFVQLILHTFFFGVPLSLFYATAERRLQPLMRAIQTNAQRPLGHVTLRGVDVHNPHPSMR